MSTLVEDNLNVTADLKMLWLRHALNPNLAQGQLLKALRRPLGSCDQLDLAAIRVLRHKPGRRCLIEYSVSAESRRYPKQDFTLLGKSRTKGVDIEIHDLHCELWKNGFEAKSADGISVPRAMGLVSDFRMWLQEKVPGTVATEWFAGEPGVALARRIAEVAHKVHGLKIRPRREHEMPDELRILGERIELLAKERPEWQPRLVQLMDAAKRLGASVPAPSRRPIHRDFYPAQVLVEGGRLWLLDFDEFCLGDPALDAGNFIGHLIEHSVRTTGDARGLAAAGDALTERFLEITIKGSRAAVEAYTTLTLARLVQISTLFPERRAFTERLLELCEERLAQ